MDKAEDLRLLINSETPLIFVETWEEERVEMMLRKISEELDVPLFLWTVTDGLQRSGLPNSIFDTADPHKALVHIGSLTVDALYLLKDFPRYLEQDTVLRKLRDLCGRFRDRRRSLLLSAPAAQVPLELEKEAVVFTLGMPDAAALRTLIESTYRRLAAQKTIRNLLDAAGLDQLTSNLRGMTLAEADRLLARAMLRNNALDSQCLEEVIAAKKALIRQQGVLEFVEHSESMKSVGGMESLKRWLDKRKSAFSADAVKFGLDPPRGILITGVQGCGKSLCAKAVAQDWRLPLLKLDAGSLYDKYVGESEHRLRQALEMSDELAPATLWIDELEKGFQVSAGSAAVDGGLSSRILGFFLTWLQEHRSPVFLVATSNDISALPPELVRKGRFDEIFFVDLPGAAERREIFRVHLLKKNRKPEGFDLEALAAASEGFSGAEIEQAVKGALYTAYAAHQDLSTAHILSELKATVPLSVTRREDIEALRQWARGRAVRAN